jgi:hypothetical protein
VEAWLCERGMQFAMLGLNIEKFLVQIAVKMEKTGKNNTFCQLFSQISFFLSFFAPLLRLSICNLK